MGFKRPTYSFIKQFFEDQNCKLLEKEYKDNTTRMKFACSCGQTSETCWMSFRAGHRCKSCGGNKKYEYKDIKKYFEDQECQLL